MFDRICYPTDGSEGAVAVRDHVADLAAAHDATVHVLHVVPTKSEPFLGRTESVVEELTDAGEAAVEAAAERFEERGLTVVTEVVRGEPYRRIVDYAETQGMDLVAMPTHGRRGLERLLLGSTTERVVRQCDIPVLTARPGEDSRLAHPYGDVLVPTDGSDSAAAALDAGGSLAAAEGAALHLLSVVDVASLGIDVRTDLQLSSLEQGAERILDEAADAVADAAVPSLHRTVGHGTSVHRSVLAYVEEHDVDVVVVGTHGRTGFDRYMLGSVTEKLVRTAPVPVLTVRESAVARD